MNISKYYYYFTSALTPKFCDDVIQYALQQKEVMARTGGFGNKELNKHPQKFFSKSTVVFNTEIITTSGPAKTREEVREESGEYKVGRNGEGIGYEGIGDDTI